MPTKKFVQIFVLLTMMPSAILWLHAQSSQNVPGIALDQLELHNVKAEVANYCPGCEQSTSRTMTKGMKPAARNFKSIQQRMQLLLPQPRMVCRAD